MNYFCLLTGLYIVCNYVNVNVKVGKYLQNFLLILKSELSSIVNKD